MIVHDENNEAVVGDKVIIEAADAVTSIIYNGIHYVTNNFNRKRE